MSGGTIEVSACPRHTQRDFLKPARKMHSKAAPPTSAFGADAGNLIAIVSGITLNLPMAFNRMLKKDFRRVLHKRP